MTKSTPFQWYYHSATKNETVQALTAAVQNDCGLLVFVGKPGCHICETVWSKSHNNTEMMDGAGKMSAYLKENRLVGLKIEDSQGHFSDLASGAMGYRNPDGTATNTNAPFLVLVKVKAGKENNSVFELTKRKSCIETFFGGYGSLAMYDKTYAKITAWLKSLMSSDKYRSAFSDAPSSSGSSKNSSSSSGSPSANDTSVCRWHVHNEKKNETSKAVQTALDNNCGLLVVVSKPNCSTCEKVWGKSYMDGDGKLLQYLKDHRIVGLKIDDSQTHVQSIGSGISGYTNYDKSKMDKNVPFLFLVKPKAGITTFETLKKKTSIDEFFGGFGSKNISGQKYEQVSAWLDKMLEPSLKYHDNRRNYATVYGLVSTAVQSQSFTIRAKVEYEVEVDLTAESLADAKTEFGKIPIPDFGQIAGLKFSTLKKSSTITEIKKKD